MTSPNVVSLHIWIQQSFIFWEVHNMTYFHLHQKIISIPRNSNSFMKCKNEVRKCHYTEVRGFQLKIIAIPWVYHLENKVRIDGKEQFTWGGDTHLKPSAFQLWSKNRTNNSGAKYTKSYRNWLLYPPMSSEFEKPFCKSHKNCRVNPLAIRLLTF